MKPRTRRVLLIALGVVAATVAIAAIWFVWWGLTPLGPAPTALGALESDAAVGVSKSDAGWVFAPTSGEATSGFVFYPGGHVDARSYAPYAHDVAAQGYLVVVPVMPLSLAVLSPNAASKAIEAYPAVRLWLLGGHSLGGVMAARYADKNSATVNGLVLLASYPAGSADISDSEIDVASLVGSQDTVVDMATWEKARSQLPPSAQVKTLEGGNHAQFGDYGLQPGDTPRPDMGAQEQRAAAVSATVGVLRAEQP